MGLVTAVTLKATTPAECGDCSQAQALHYGRWLGGVEDFAPARIPQGEVAVAFQSQALFAAQKGLLFAGLFWMDGNLIFF